MDEFMRPTAWSGCHASLDSKSAHVVLAFDLLVIANCHLLHTKQTSPAHPEFHPSSEPQSCVLTRKSGVK